MSKAVSNIIPILTSEAGLSLTSANWQEVDCKVVVYYLDSLLLKPGHAFLMNLDDLAHYVNCPGDLILNASLFKANKEGIFTLTSPFDGTKIRLDYHQLIDLIRHLKPQKVILPTHVLRDYPELWDNWPDDVIPYLAEQDLLLHSVQRVHGIYFTIDNLDNECIEQLGRWAHLSRYVQGRTNFALMQNLRDLGIEWIESDDPAASALQGIVYSSKGLIDLTKSESSSTCFETIDAECECPTCTSQLTKAYLHHLYHHTPLLCQRFLVQHNAYYAQKIT